MRPDWNALVDISDQVAEAGDAMGGEAYAAADEDWAEHEDERAPSRAEAERDDFDDWSWWRR